MALAADRNDEAGVVSKPGDFFEGQKESHLQG
jgi:hypothetical protein